MLKISCHLCNAPTSLRVDNRRNDCYELWYATKDSRLDLPKLLVAFFESSKHAPAYNEELFSFCTECVADPRAFETVWRKASSLRWHCEFFNEKELRWLIDHASHIGNLQYDSDDEDMFELDTWRECRSITHLADVFRVKIQLSKDDIPIELPEEPRAADSDDE